MSFHLPQPAVFLRWRRRHPRLWVFSGGLLVRIAGLLLIWVADGHTSIFSKAVVILGVILSVFGIGILKWLAMQPRRRWAADVSPRAAPPTP